MLSPKENYFCPQSLPPSPPLSPKLPLSKPLPLRDNLMKNLSPPYNEVFINAISYWAFTENKVRLRKNALEYKHFDTMYTNHRSLVNTIRKLCQQAQLLLEEANILTGRDYILRQEIETHVSRITKAKLCKRLHKPTHSCFKEMPIPSPQPQASSSWILITHQHPIHYT